MFKLIISGKNCYKIGLIFIVIATFMSTIILPDLDTKITSLEKEINDYQDQVIKNVLAWMQYTSIENRIEILCFRSDLIEEYKKDTLDRKIFIQSATLTHAYSGWWSSGEEQKKLMKNAEEKIKEIKNSSNINEVRIQKIMSLLEVERNDGLIRMNNFQDELEKLQNRLKDKQLNRNRLYSIFALFQILGLVLISLGSLLKK